MQNKITNSDNGNENESDHENTIITNKKQIILGATINNNKGNFHQREEFTPAENSIVILGDSMVKHVNEQELVKNKGGL